MIISNDVGNVVLVLKLYKPTFDLAGWSVKFMLRLLHSDPGVALPILDWGGSGRSLIKVPKNSHYIFG